MNNEAKGVVVGGRLNDEYKIVYIKVPLDYVITTGNTVKITPISLEEYENE